MGFKFLPQIKPAVSNHYSEAEESRILDWFAQFHPWDFIHARANPEKKNKRRTNKRNGSKGKVTETKANWKTETRYPLHPRSLYEHWAQPDLLVGIRPSSYRDGTFPFLIIDIDVTSPYYPRCKRNEAQLKAMLGTLEEIGLCRFVPIRSSNSGGLHIYFPLPEPVGCDGLAKAAYETLRQAGFEIRNGVLEIFPNIRADSRVKTLFQGIRLPLQQGSCVLTQGFQPDHRCLLRLIDTFDRIKVYQDMDVLKEAIAHYRQRQYCTPSVPYLTPNIREWKERLEETWHQGWESYGQTNDILKNLCIYARVFLARSWQQVESWVLEQVYQMPGYWHFCQHQHEIKRRVRDWVRCNERHNRYYPLTRKKRKRLGTGPTNEERQADAERRIREAIAQLKEAGGLPDGVKQRQGLICETAKCSATTLWKYKDLWHPKYEVKSDIPEVEDTSVEATVTTTREEFDLRQWSCFEALSSSASFHLVEGTQFIASSGVTHPVLTKRGGNLLPFFANESALVKSDISTLDQQGGDRNPGQQAQKAIARAINTKRAIATFFLTKFGVVEQGVVEQKGGPTPTSTSRAP